MRAPNTPRYRRHKLSGKIHLVGSGCKYTYGRWTVLCPELTGMEPEDILEHLDEEGAFALKGEDFDPVEVFCVHCFGFEPV